ncbi:hypothetical protein [Flavobacterium sp.]|uniref:hypothetical protein n=1 Tax=Flavobacterium sp. TaxID=239 RepID=UPI0025C57396|nr:hypothetical protein [Flavobacterium sp.]|tara:strand:+ start:1084 stop:1251 length:168 start_codon:yes stop_codon:yes gene_type:complete
MKKIPFLEVFPHALVLIMGVFVWRYEYTQAWICIVIGTLLWLVKMGNDIRNGSDN